MVYELPIDVLRERIKEFEEEAKHADLGSLDSLLARWKILYHKTCIMGKEDGFAEDDPEIVGAEQYYENVQRRQGKMDRIHGIMAADSLLRSYINKDRTE